MVELKAGVYDAIVTSAIAEALEKSELSAAFEKVDAAEAADQYSRLIAVVVRRAIAAITEKDRASVGAELTNSIFTMVAERVRAADTGDDCIADREKPRTLLSLATSTPDGRVSSVTPPRTPLAQTALLTNAPGEPTLLHQLGSEIASADAVDILGAFIRFTGIRELLPPIRHLTERGGKVRVLTTTYTGTTERRALDELTQAGAEVRVSYDRTATRLHAKAWLFQRDSGFTTVYIGSSNLTHQAQVTGMEWNVRASVVGNPVVVEKFSATFESYWNDQSFAPYRAEEFDAQHRAATTPRDTDEFSLAFVDLIPKPFQQGLLERLEFERTMGHHCNLIVAATGTGKTVMAAIDYRELRTRLERSNLLFVAHRKEILKQSRATFQLALRSASFGELWVDGKKPLQWKHVFASIQSLSSGDLTALPADHFDVVIIDEFHHAEAPSYQTLLQWVKPRELLGLTATPERTDGMNVADRFDGRIAAELRLWDALEQGLLSPFHYFGVADGTDLSGVAWSGGRYDAVALTNVYTANDVWLGKVLQALKEKVTDPMTMRALGFCVSVEHARFMAAGFLKAGLKATAITGQTHRDDRANAIEDLRCGTLQAIFTVDVFNEGVDIPEIDTVLFLRPTESATIFLQQLGRGLRRTDAGAYSVKDVLTVLDFVGHQHTKFRFDQRFRKLLGGTWVEVEKQIKDDFPYLPAGCAINLDTVSKELVLANIKAAVPTGWSERKRESRLLGDISLAEFLKATGLELADIYAGDRSYTELRRAVGHLQGKLTDDEKLLGRAIGRLLHLNDPQRLQAFIDLIAMNRPPNPSGFDEWGRRLATQLHYLLWGVGKRMTLTEGWSRLWSSPSMLEELRSVLLLLQSAPLEAVGQSVFGTTIPLQLHALYSRDEVLAAFDVGKPEKPPQLREGVKWVQDKKIDLLFITLKKSERDFSPTTMYQDYAISRQLFHWESQSQTSEASPTGQRYIHHRKTGSRVALLVRSAKKDGRGRTAPYLCVGLADYVSHTGDRPMAITWRLHAKLPVGAFLNYRAAVA